MAGFDFVIHGTADLAFAAVRAAAQAEHYEVSEDEDGGLRARKGNFASSLVLGAFFPVYELEFEVQAEGPNVRLTMTRNHPWWTGMIGISRVKKAAVRFADAIQHSAGAQVRSRKAI